MEQVRPVVQTLVSRYWEGVINTAEKQKHATTVYHVMWAEVLRDTLTVLFIEKKKYGRFVSRLRYKAVRRRGLNWWKAC